MASNVAYKYSALVASDEIRLVHILPGKTASPVLCEIIHSSLGKNTPYEALSYTWGSLDSPLTICANSFALNVSGNLHEALQRLRLPYKKRMMWIDAISINQDDTAERSLQVGLMREIFKHATNVVVWLGEETKTSNQAIAFLKEMGEDAISRSEKGSASWWSKTKSELIQARNNRTGSVLHSKLIQHNTEDHAYNIEGHNLSAGNESLLWGIPVLYYDFSTSTLWDYINESRNADWEAVDELLARPWWARTWVVQEVWNAASVTLQCGGASVDWMLFQAAMDYHEAWDEMGDIMIMHKVTRANIWKLLRRRYSLAIHISKQRVNNSALADLLWNTWDREATDPRDKVFAMLNLVGENFKDGTMVPDYEKSMVKVFSEATRVILEGQKKIDILLAANGISRKDGLPSWVPDWRREANDCRPTLFVNKAKFFREYVSGSTDFIATRGHGFAACGKTTPEFGFDDALTTLSVLSFCFDTISELTDVFQIDEDRPLWEVNVWGWAEAQEERDAALESCIASAEDLARSSHWFPTAEEIHQWQMNALNDSIRTVGEQEEFYKRCKTGNSSPIDLGIRLGKVPTAEGVFTKIIWNILGAGHTAYSESGKKNSQLAVIRNVMKRRRFFVTENGRLGIGPRDAEKGDCVVVIGGCNYPMVLRKDEGGRNDYGLVGEAYVHGAMNGEVLQSTPEGVDIQMEKINIT